MTKKDTMAKLPGLFKREGVYQLRVMIPKDLQGAYGGRTKLALPATRCAQHPHTIGID